MLILRVKKSFLHVGDWTSANKRTQFWSSFHLGLSLGGDGGSHGGGHFQRQSKGSREAVRVPHDEGACPENNIIFN